MSKETMKTGGPECSQFFKSELRLRNCTAHFRFWGKCPQMLLEIGSQDGPIYVEGREDLEAIAEQIKRLLQ